jgi:hypothetical protein
MDYFAKDAGERGNFGRALHATWCLVLGTWYLATKPFQLFDSYFLILTSYENV